MFLQKEQALQFLKDFNLMCFLWSLKNTMAILVSKKEKKKNLSFFVVIENLDQIVLKLSLMTGRLARCCSSRDCSSREVES